ncbi:MAG: DUF4248 domain-containing protein [Bacteroidales bacterium]|nr:DUF4248 domain-containing protein [Bacteroidales bacterium]
MENKPKIEALTKFQLVRKYYPDADKNQVFRFFKMEVHSCASLMEKLEKLGYKKSRKKLNVNMVKAIYEHLTYPEI